MGKGGAPITSGRKQDGTFGEGNTFSRGRPKGSKHRLSEEFLCALTDDFEKHGAETIERMRESDPAAYIRVIASLMPKHIEADTPLAGLSDDELAEAIDLLLQILGEIDRAEALKRIG